jgi:hypothetical protein
MKMERSPLLTVCHSGEDLGLAEVGATFVALWRSKPTFPSFEIQRAELAKVVGHEPGNATFLCVVEGGCAPPDEPLRKASSEMIAAHGPNLRKVACVIEGRGFKSAITRSVLSGMQFILRSPTEIKFFPTVFDAALWLDGDAHRAIALARAVEVLRGQLPARQPRLTARI